MLPFIDFLQQHQLVKTFLLVLAMPLYRPMDNNVLAEKTKAFLG